MSVEGQRRRPVRITINPVLVLFVALIAMLGGIALVQPTFVGRGNLENMLVQASYLSLFAYAQTLPILTRGFDLSLGATVSVISLVTALTMVALLPYGAFVTIAGGVGAGLAAGLALGAINGFMIGPMAINPFIVTLGTWNILAGLASLISGGFPVVVLPEFNLLFSQARPLGIPVSVLAALGVAALVWVVLERTAFGRRLMIVGSNPEAASLAGIDRRKVIFLAYVACSGIAALGAIMLTARTGSGEPNLGGNLTLQSIAAAVLGGVSLRGGEGRFYAAILGAAFITVLSSALNFFRIDAYLQNVVLGAVIILAVCISRPRA